MNLPKTFRNSPWFWLFFYKFQTLPVNLSFKSRYKEKLLQKFGQNFTELISCINESNKDNHQNFQNHKSQNSFKISKQFLILNSVFFSEISYHQILTESSTFFLLDACQKNSLTIWENFREFLLIFHNFRFFVIFIIFFVFWFFCHFYFFEIFSSQHM